MVKCCYSHLIKTCCLCQINKMMKTSLYFAFGFVLFLLYHTSNLVWRYILYHSELLNSTRVHDLFKQQLFDSIQLQIKLRDCRKSSFAIVLLVNLNQFGQSNQVISLFYQMRSGINHFYNSDTCTLYLFSFVILLFWTNIWVKW